MERDQTHLEMLEGDEGKGETTPATAPAKGLRLTKAEVQAVKQRMAVAERYYETKFKPHYEEVMRLQRGDHYKGQTSVDSDDHQAVLNMIPHVVETKVYSTTFNHPEIIVKPKDRQGDENLAVAEQVTSCEYKAAHAQRETRRAFRDAQLFNFGVLATGWEFETDEVHLTDGRRQVEGEEPEPEAVLRAVESGKDLPAPVPRAKVRKDNFYVKRLDPRNWRISPESSWVIEDAPYCGYVEDVEVSALKKDPRYKNTRGIKGTAEQLKGYLGSDDTAEGGKDDLHDDMKRVRLQHYYERRRRLHVAVCGEVEGALLVEEWHWEHDEYPFLPIFDTPGEDGWYQPPPILHWKTCQQELNYFHTQLAIHIRRFTRKYVARNGAFSPTEEEKLAHGEDGSIIYTNDPSPADALIPVQDAQMSPDAYSMERIAFDYLSRISGLDQFSMGRAPTKRMTQDEAAMVRESGGARQQAARSAYEDLCSSVARHCLMLNQQYAIRTRSYPVYADGKVAEWKDWTGDEIRGEYQFEVYVGSTELKDKQGIAEEIGFLIQALTPFFQMPQEMAGMMIADPRQLLRQLLANIPEIKDISAIVPAEAPMQADPMMDPALMGGEGDPLDQLASQMGAPAPGGMEPMPPQMGMEAY